MTDLTIKDIPPGLRRDVETLRDAVATSDLRAWAALGRVMKALAAQPAPTNEPRAPSYDALLIIAQSVGGALNRAGVTDCDDPGEAIDVLREGYEKRIAELESAQLAPAAAAVPEGWVLVPRACTDEMDEAAMLALCGSIGGYEAGRWMRAWDAALSAAPQPATCNQPLHVHGEDKAWSDDDGSQDDAVWNLIGIAERCGAKKDSDGNSTWWTIGVRGFYVLEGVLRERVSNAMYLASEPKPADGMAAGPYHAVRDDNGHAYAIADSTGYYIVHLQCGTTRNESDGGVDKLLRLLNASAGSGEAVGVVCLTPDPYAHGAMVELQVQLAPGAKAQRGMTLYTAPPAADAELLDELERLANSGGVLIHSGDFEAAKRACVGIGLRPGSVVRTLRGAIDDASRLAGGGGA